MNEIPINWATELKAAFPAKSGPVGWGSMKLLLALRRALMQSTWGEIIDGCQRYKAYCEQSGRQGTEFVQSPLRFIEDGCHLEEFTYQAPKTKEEIERARLAGLASEHMQRAIDGAVQAGSPSRPYSGESAAAFETRLRIEQDNQRPVRRGDALGESIRNLAGRLRVAK